jgi:8-oxo-dGTP diphosphatase
MNPVIRVTAAVIEKGQKVLVAKRKKGDRFEGLWEFPGGKIEPGETEQACLSRELYEEFGITSEIKSIFHRHIYSYAHADIELITMKVNHLSGEFLLNDHDEIKWLTPVEINNLELVPADREIAKKLQAQNAGL